MTHSGTPSNKANHRDFPDLVSRPFNLLFISPGALRLDPLSSKVFTRWLQLLFKKVSFITSHWHAWGYLHTGNLRGKSCFLLSPAYARGKLGCWRSSVFVLLCLTLSTSELRQEPGAYAQEIFVQWIKVRRMPQDLTTRILNNLLKVTFILKLFLNSPSWFIFSLTLTFLALLG